MQKPVIYCSEFIRIQSFFNQYLKSHKTDRIFLLCDSNTEDIWNKDHILDDAVKIVFPAGEDNKNIQALITLSEFLTRSLATKNSILVNLGGGVVSDLGGFAASVYKRGIRYINVPTTLLAMVDAAIGGKTGINLGSVKNQIGSFHFPEAVLIWPGFLRTLPEREWCSGKGELFKYSLLGAGFSLEEISENNDPEGISHLIQLSAAFKHRIVTRDPKDNGIRMILNFGHTIGHALESEALSRNIPLTHGEAVAAGILAELFLLSQHGITTEDLIEETMNVYRRLFDPALVRQILNGDPAAWIHHDKKATGKTISLPAIPFHEDSFRAIALQTEQIASGFTFLKNQL